MLVPTQSILTQARNKQVVICKNGMAKFSVVETGVRDSSYVEIVTGCT